MCLFEKILRLWGDKSHLFTNQQLKHACKWIIAINSRILHALACLVLSHPLVFVSWTIFSADSYWKACFARTVCLPGAIPEFTGGSLGNLTSSQLCVSHLQKLPIITSSQVQWIWIHGHLQIDLFGFHLHSILHMLVTCMSGTCAVTSVRHKFFGNNL